MKPNKTHSPAPPKNLITVTIWWLLMGVLATPIVTVTGTIMLVLVKLAPGAAYVWLALWVASIVFLVWWVYKIVDRPIKRLQNAVIGKVSKNRREG